MIRFFLKLTLIVLLLILIDHESGIIENHFYFHENNGEGSQISFVINDVTADMLIFGSSRANHHYVPEVFENRLHYTCYNAGKDGNFLLYNYAIFKAIVKRYDPKLVIFDIRPYELGDIDSEYERLSLLMPYYNNIPEIRQVVDLRGPFEKLKHISSIYPYNSMLFQIIRGNLKKDKGTESDSEGYIPLHKLMKKEKIKHWDLSNISIDQNKINALYDIISTCKQKHIELVFVYSPIWKINDEKNNQISKICSAQNIRYFDMSNDTEFMNNPQYFEDLSHLNDEGARIFSNLLANKLLVSDREAGNGIFSK